MVTRERLQRVIPILERVGYGLAAFLLFVLAVEVMKEGAGSLAPLIQNYLAVTNAADSLGVGWLMAYLILSGSPVAAIAMALLSTRAILPAQALTMVTGSRLGASFIVLMIGFIYTLRGHERKTALATGILSLLLTGSVQLLALPVGLLLVGRGEWLGSVEWPVLTSLCIGINSALDPALAPVAAVLPQWLLFLIGVGLIIVSFRLFDKALPQLRLTKTGLGQIPRLVYRPVIMFLLGMIITVLTMSVSISIGILVPLSARGYVRRENLIPYILGANVSTLVDTLAAAMLLCDPRAVTIVLIHMASSILVSLPVVLLAYRPYERTISRALVWVTNSRKNFALFLGAIFIIPIILILL
jgi:sodium-dependent phosphate cotransporter